MALLGSTMTDVSECTPSAAVRTVLLALANDAEVEWWQPIWPRSGCTTSLAALDCSGLLQLATVGDRWLSDCTSLTALDCTGLKHWWLSGCTGLQALLASVDFPAARVSRRRTTRGLYWIVQPMCASAMRQPKKCWGGVHITRNSGGVTVASGHTPCETARRAAKGLVIPLIRGIPLKRRANVEGCRATDVSGVEANRLVSGDYVFPMTPRSSRRRSSTEEVLGRCRALRGAPAAGRWRSVRAHT